MGNLPTITSFVHVDELQIARMTNPCIIKSPKHCLLILFPSFARSSETRLPLHHLLRSIGAYFRQIPVKLSDLGASHLARSLDDILSMAMNDTHGLI